VTATIRKILKETAASDQFIDSLKMIWPKKQLHPILGHVYTRLDEDDPVRGLLDRWIMQLKANTRNKSDLSIRNIITFYLKTLLPQLGLSLGIWPDDIGKVISVKLNNSDTVRAVCGDGVNAKRKFKWVCIFCEHIVACDVSLQAEWIDTTGSNQPKKDELSQEDGSDHHRISAHDLDKIYSVAKENVKDELMYMLLITTGMRVGGLVRIKTEHIAVIMSNDVDIKLTGRTLEKGRKWFSFVMNDQVRRLAYDWIMNYRKADTSPYLFPGQCASRDHVTTTTIRNIFHRWCAKVGLHGKEFHPHSLRHSYAHILLESGNPVEVVSKLLNHSSTKVTEKFYLKENAAEVADRANIPWLIKSNKRKRQIVPDFLVQEKPRNSDTKQKKKKHRKAMAGLDMFNDSSQR